MGRLSRRDPLRLGQSLDFALGLFGLLFGMIGNLLFEVLLVASLLGGNRLGVRILSSLFPCRFGEGLVFKDL